MESAYQPVIQDGVCLSCMCKRDDSSKTVDQRLTDSVRKVAFLTAITCVLCVLTISACGCSVYIYTQFRSFHSELTAMVRVELSAGNQASVAEALQMDADSSYSADYEDAPEKGYIGRNRRKDNQKAGKDSRRGNKKCKGKCKDACKCAVKSAVRKIRSMITKGELGTPPTTPAPQKQETPTSTPTPSPIPIKAQFSYIAAAHYTSYVDLDFIKNKMGELDHANLGNAVNCKDIPEWRGTLCRNRTFTASDAPLTLNVFKESGWMSSQSDIEKIFTQESDGAFRARHTGIYLLYAHAYFKTKSPPQLNKNVYATADNKNKSTAEKRNGIAIIHKNRSGFEMRNNITCMPGVPAENEFRDEFPCAVSATVLIKQHDMIKIELLDNDFIVSFKEEDLYFGGILYYTITL